MKIKVKRIALVAAIQTKRKGLVTEKERIEGAAKKEFAAYKIAVLKKAGAFYDAVEAAATDTAIAKAINGARYNSSWPDEPESDTKVARKIAELDEILKRLALSSEEEHTLDEKSNYFEFI